LLAQNELLQRLEEKYADFKAQYVDALGQYGPKFPKVVRLGDQAEEIRSLIDSERKRTVARIRNEYLAASGRERLLAVSVARQRAEVENLNQLLIRHNMLKREFETNQQLYESLLKHVKDATVSAGLRATNLHVLDTASPPAIPARPNKVLNIALGLIAGLVIGVTIAFVQEDLDYSIKTTEEVERLIGAPSLAVIPRVGSTGSRLYGLSKARDRTAENAAPARAILENPNSILAESYRALRTSVLFSRAPRPPKTVLVTSPQPNEGKTCTSLNLALALARQGARVLIIDADLRKPDIAESLGVDNGTGLSGVLTGAYSLESSLRQVEMPLDLSVLAAGPRPPNPSELLSSPAMERILRELNERFDHIVLDSPPLLMVTDATILSTLVDGVILVVESGLTSRDALLRAHKTIKISGGRVLGVVLNKVNLRQNGYNRYYAKYYSSHPDLKEEEGAGAAAEPAVPKSSQQDS
jgi:capsular exopolysaccharide synthesis family protein